MHYWILFPSSGLVTAAAFGFSQLPPPQNDAADPESQPDAIAAAQENTYEMLAARPAIAEPSLTSQPLLSEKLTTDADIAALIEKSAVSPERNQRSADEIARISEARVAALQQLVQLMSTAQTEAPAASAVAGEHLLPPPPPVLPVAGAAVGVASRDPLPAHPLAQYVNATVDKVALETPATITEAPAAATGAIAAAAIPAVDMAAAETTALPLKTPAPLEKKVAVASEPPASAAVAISDRQRLSWKVCRRSPATEVSGENRPACGNTAAQPDPQQPAVSVLAQSHTQKLVPRFSKPVTGIMQLMVTNRFP